MEPITIMDPICAELSRLRRLALAQMINERVITNGGTVTATNITVPDGSKYPHVGRTYDDIKARVWYPFLMKGAEGDYSYWAREIEPDEIRNGLAAPFIVTAALQ
jgi:hypothetical protein